VSRSRLGLVALLLLVVAGAAFGAAALRHRGTAPQRRAAAPCQRHEEAATEAGRERGGAGTRGAGGRAALYAGPAAQEPPCGDRPGLPESFADLAKANSSIAARAVAPGTQVRGGAYRAAVRSAAALPHTPGSWTPFGSTPLDTGRTEYDQTQGSTHEGLGKVAGRMTSIARDPATGRLFAAGSNAGVWTSTDGGDHWTSIGDGLPTQVVAGVAWTPAGGGTVIALTGDDAFGGSSLAGLGAYRSTDLGGHWTHASGVPDGVLGFKLAVDPAHPAIVYAATGAGLWRSTDAGASYVNVNLPTGENAPSGTPDCTGKSPAVKDCFLANMVTGVVVQGPDNAATPDGGAGAVLAAVGWRAGTKQNQDGSEQSPGNGIYRSPTGAPGTFTNVHIEDHNAPQGGDTLNHDQIGRIGLGIANGSTQNHQVVYALVEDAVKFNGGAGGIDASEQGVPNPTYLNALWVTTDFGGAWREQDGSNHIDSDTTSNSALAPPVCAGLGYCPGVQAWYNLWVEPDPSPSQTTAAGVPERLAFGLEEVWTNDPALTAPTGLDGTPVRSIVVGRYFAGDTCTFIIVTNALPLCPAASGGSVPATTTHPDQHGALWIPDSSGGVTLMVANDGGIYKQQRNQGEDLSNDAWGTGSNVGLHTLQPYDIGIAKDGTAYMGLQDNGEAKIEPDGTSYTVYGGDGFFSAVNPDDAKTAYEEYTNGAISVTTDGGKNWKGIQPDGLTDGQFSTPFEMDAGDADHLIIGGSHVFETFSGPGTDSSSWNDVYDLGTRQHPGDPSAGPTADDPDNQASAFDVRSVAAPPGAPTGPHTPDESYTAGGDTMPGGVQVIGDVFPPGTYTDHEITTGPNDGNRAMKVRIDWADSANDWDLFVYRKESDGSLTEVGYSAEGGTDFEQVNVANPPAATYVVRVANYSASGTFDAAITFEQRTAGNSGTGVAYAAYCGYCDTITQGTPFGSGVATNVGGTWHIAEAKGLPKRYITSVRMDPTDPRTVYATLAGYGRKWAFPGAVGEDTSQIGTGHVFKSTDGGATFANVSGDLPDVPANWSVLHKGHLVVGTDIGVFESCDSAGGGFSQVGTGLPTVPVSTMRFKPGDPDLLVVATFGRGAYTYRFGADNKRCATPVKSPAATGGTPPPSSSPQPVQGGSTACTALAGFKRVRVGQAAGGLRFEVQRRVSAPFTVDVFRESAGRRILREHRVGHFPARRSSFTWRTGRGVGDGYYFVRVLMQAGARSDAYRVALRRQGGRFATRPAFSAHRHCQLIRLARLTRPVFGGSNGVPLRVSGALRRAGALTVEVRRGTTLVARRRFAHAGTHIRQVSVPASRTRPGDYRVTVIARSGTERERVRLTGRRL
jgi:hypothetical protein